MNLSLDARILQALRNAPGHLGLAELSGATETDMPTLSQRLAALRAAGYELEDHPHLGVRLISAPDRLIADDLAAMLDGCRLPREIIVFEQTRSTNDVAAQMGRVGAGEGVTIFAEEQTAGRGRLGRVWKSESRAGLWFSLLLRPQIPTHEWMRLTTFAGVCVARAVEEILRQSVAIKWPNDVFLGGKKVAGILIESQPGERGFAVLGIGLNVNQTEFPEPITGQAVSLRQVAGRKLDRSLVAVTVLRWIDTLYPKLHDDFAEIVAAASARSYLRGHWIDTPEEGTCGVAEALDENGALILRKADGSTVSLCSGEVSITQH